MSKIETPRIGHRELRRAVEDFLQETCPAGVLMKDGTWFLMEDGRVMHVCFPTAFTHGMWRKSDMPNRMMYEFAATTVNGEPTKMGRDWVGHCTQCELRVPKRMRMLWFLTFGLANA